MNPSPSIRPIAVKWGTILGVLSILNVIYTYFVVGVPQVGEFNIAGTVIGVLVFALAIVCYVMAVKDFRKINDGGSSFGEGFKVIMLTIIVGSIISLIFSYLMDAVIMPDYNEEMYAMTMGTMESSPGMTDSMLEIMDNMYSFIFSATGKLIVGAFGTLIGGAVFASIVALIMQRDPDLTPSVDEIGTV
ncbi:DUF4199 domain-containing protein [Pontibacter sp. G13]|uniref:DUF4199 domain-containing protein n=1 Tax=Pontibacter sp. G13 TaxID=3074898 RepID=UPI0028896277|nr:DUF4199 domain-containing protein [Pontibacter sp. G13]WNJ20768.1 DUF4199 domain-containing protein [Pontibacter sp. G13]